ncbi:putative bifunctional diguanylate cyclase/phosphodiesterase [Rhizobium alvei]|uniref:Bifunctional diguanylate cyclase/phosphodiesterase n=1 Tax=Rhizobium alvei TaxID=1132659 RepID=A0ABT8YI95_9HYPH|nr:bifunctional diguanylate cyclase/phosphodiesterase [Rhizobium alvei]MDO6963314.1 bifunctional diguanylate cyclase/phosphodiesterase [Rhizobium alvei]
MKSGLSANTLRKLYMLRFPVVLIGLGVMFFVTVGNISQISDKLGMHLFNSARYEEATRAEMELNDLIGKAFRFSRGVPSVSHSDVELALDILWSRIEVLATQNYQQALSMAEVNRPDYALELAAALPQFEKAVKQLEFDRHSSFAAFLPLIEKFQDPIMSMSDTAYIARRNQMRKMVEQEKNSLDSLRDLQVQFSVAAVALFLFVVFELVNSRRVNQRLNVAMGEKERMLVVDGLTGIGNRRALERTLACLSSQHDFSLVSLDLDGFKEVNDALGHAAGDFLLQHVARCLVAASDPSRDLVVRLGGDEFAVIVQGGRDRAASFSEQVRTAIQMPLDFDGKAIHVTSSIGFAHASDIVDRDFIGTLMKYADLALYASKAGGRNCVHAATSDLIDEHIRRRRIEQDMPAALENSGMHVAFQPILRLDNGHLDSIETLVRWTHPVLGPVPADQIVRAAEHTNQILPMTLMVLNAACEMRKVLERQHSKAQVAVNLSPRLLGYSGLAARISAILLQHQCPPQALVLELTEDAAMVRSDVSDANVEALRALGVSFSIDDFGTGYSNLSRLGHGDFQQIKLDRSLVSQIAANARTRDIVANVTRMAKDLGMVVVGEGIETEEDAAQLQGLGVTLGQGFYLGRPMSASMLCAWLEKNAVQSIHSLPLAVAR